MKLFLTLLFLFCINDIVQIVQNLLVNDGNIQNYVEINRSFIYLLLFAEGTVLFAKDPGTLQDLLNKLHMES